MWFVTTKKYYDDDVGRIFFHVCMKRRKKMIVMYFLFLLPRGFFMETKNFPKNPFDRFRHFGRRLGPINDNRTESDA